MSPSSGDNARVQGHDAKHADADDGGTVAHGGRHEGLLDQVFTHGKEPLGNGLVTDGVGQHGGNVGGTLVQEGV